MACEDFMRHVNTLDAPINVMAMTWSEQMILEPHHKNIMRSLVALLLCNMVSWSKK